MAGADVVMGTCDVITDCENTLFTEPVKAGDTNWRGCRHTMQWFSISKKQAVIKMKAFFSKTSKINKPSSS